MRFYYLNPHNKFNNRNKKEGICKDESQRPRINSKDYHMKDKCQQMNFLALQKRRTWTNLAETYKVADHYYDVKDLRDRVLSNTLDP